MVVLGLFVTRWCAVLAVFVSFSAAAAWASIPEPIDQTSVTSANVGWFDGPSVNAQEQKDSGQNVMNGLVVKFAKYDVLFWDLIGNAAHGATDGYQMKYKFNF
jgi:hypothetical protein